jgi:hypothetical protein
VRLTLVYKNNTIKKRNYLAGLPVLSFPHLSSALAGAAMIYPAQASLS